MNILLRALITGSALFVGGGPPQSTGCRVGMRPTGWSEVRVVNPYIGTDPLTHIRIDVCAITFWDLRFENRDPGSDSTVAFEDLVVQIQASFEPTFTSAFADFTVQTGNTGFTNLAFDGVVDFAGPSGVTFRTADVSQLFTLDAPVTDPSFFQSQFIVYVRAWATSTIDGDPPFTALDDPQAAAGVAFVFNP